MEHEAIGQRRVAIKSVADDRMADAEGMGSVNAQLMGAAGLWLEFDACRVAVALEDLPIANAELAVLGVVDLFGPVGPVDSEGQLDMPRFACDLAFEKRGVGLGDPALFKLAR